LARHRRTRRSRSGPIRHRGAGGDGGCDGGRGARDRQAARRRGLRGDALRRGRAPHGSALSVDFDDAPEDAAFRTEFREWLQANHPGELPADPEEVFEVRRRWQRTLAENGWAAPGWPRAWGGRDASIAQLVIYQEEMALARAPV